MMIISLNIIIIYLQNENLGFANESRAVISIKVPTKSNTVSHQASDYKYCIVIYSVTSSTSIRTPSVL
jgi:hypothetical protein